MDLIRHVEARGSEFLIFALTPPRLATDSERVQEIADATIERLGKIGLDGLILYDIDDESGRNPDQRPFPFTPTIDPADFLANHLAMWPTPVIVYRSVEQVSKLRVARLALGPGPVAGDDSLGGGLDERRCAEHLACGSAGATQRGQLGSIVGWRSDSRASHEAGRRTPAAAE